MHSLQALTFDLYRAQDINMGKYRGKVLGFVTSQIRGSQGYILLTRRHCTGYVVYSPLYPSLYRSIVPYAIPCTLYYERAVGINVQSPYGTFTVGVVGIGQKNTPQGVSLTRYVMSGTLTLTQW